MNRNSLICIYTEILIYFFICEAFPTTIFTSFPKTDYIRKWYIIELISWRKIYNYEGDTVLFLKFTHEFNLMFMDVLNWKCICCTFFCIKTYRNSLNNTNIVNRTFLVKICQCNMSCALVYINWFYGCWNLLDKCKICLLYTSDAADE